MNKVIESNYPTIRHLPNSRLTDRGDRNLGEQETR